MSKHHGLSYMPVYKVWTAMLQRCSNPNNDRWQHYGGRGISVCDRWQGSEGPVNFIEDMGPRPDKATLDRIDNDGDYAPENCRWATYAEQNVNRRGNHRLEIDGISRTISQWSEVSGVHKGTILGRIQRGLPPKEAVFTKQLVSSTSFSSENHPRSRYFEIGDQRKNIKEWAESRGIPVPTVRSRLRRGWTMEKALGL